MPSPFPGMDPYLENPVWWPDFHHSFITYARDALQPGLRPHYRARISERVYIIEPPQHYYPDIAILGKENKKETPFLNVDGGNSLFAAAESEEPLIITLPKEAQKQGFIEILHADGAVVSVIEVLSPVNKTPWRERLHYRVYPRGLNDYREKQRQLIESATHLVEIDLLRRGTHAVAVPSELVAEQCATWDYLVCEFTNDEASYGASRVGQKPQAGVFGSLTNAKGLWLSFRSLSRYHPQTSAAHPRASPRARPRHRAGFTSCICALL